jgi:tRNA threonylcarbamoyladenosine biosynthesis protein TsaB
MSPKILAIDTALDACSIAIQYGNLKKESYLLAPRQQTQLILPMLERLLEESQLELIDFDVLALSSGPGSFTGLRIGSSVIQALAFTTEKPVVLVSTLQTLAQGFWREHQISQAAVVIDAHMQEVYWGIYQLDADNLMQATCSDQLNKPESIIISCKSTWAAIGNGWKTYDKILLTKAASQPCMIDSERLPHALDMLEIAAAKFKRGEYVTAEKALPNYLRGNQAWKKIK